MISEFGRTLLAVNVCVYMCVCCVHVCECTCTYVYCVHVSVYMYVCCVYLCVLYICTCLCVTVYMHIHVCKCLSVWMWICRFLFSLAQRGMQRLNAMVTSLVLRRTKEEMTELNIVSIIITIYSDFYLSIHLFTNYSQFLC